MSQPLVSVIVPVWNCRRFVDLAVYSALAQTVGDLEVILIDDASTDGSDEVLARLAREDQRVRCLQNTCNMGVAETRNRGFAKARGKYIALLDADDVWLPGKLEAQLAQMELSGCDFCYTSYSFIDEAGEDLGKDYLVPRQVVFSQLLSENVIGCSTVVLSAQLLTRYKMRSQYAHEDYVLWLELLRDGHKACGVRDVLVKYRILEGSRSGDKGRAAANRWRI